VFASLLDRSRWPAWSGHDAFELVQSGAAGPYEVGSVGLLRSGRRVMREEIVEVVADRRVGYTLLAGLPLRAYRADFDLTPTADGTEVRWRATFEAPPGFGWIYVAALRRFTGRLLQGLSERLRARTTTGR
jgi:Polyketide cyclase / dehydrase and lipid transport